MKFCKGKVLMNLLLLFVVYGGMYNTQKLKRFLSSIKKKGTR